jgi:V8-like Glu-specific endopeptidase
MEKYDNLPYSAVVYIMAYCSGNATIQSSGVLIGKTTILTVAHAVYNRQHDLEAESIIAYVYKNGSLEMLPIKKHHFR